MTDILVSAKDCVSSANMRKRTPASLPTNAISGFGDTSGANGGITLENNTPVKPTQKFC